jgi:fumarate hydratase subunit beta
LKELRTPLQDRDIEEIEAGEEILLSGEVFTARDAAHKRFILDFEKGRELPFPTEGAVIFYAGPTPSPEGGIGVIGPTTASRLDTYVNFLLEKGVKGFIGKGPRGREVVKVLQNRGIYFMALGGAAVYLSQFVKEAEVIAYEDLGAEAVYRLILEKFPLTVGIDFKGKTLFEEVK